MRSKPVAKDLHRRSSVVEFSQLSLARFLKPLLTSGGFGLVLMSAFSAAATQEPPAVGTIAGSAAVSATGAATYTISIGLPPGTNGMQPSLALVYDSQSSQGLAGYGWTISGLSAITRCPWTIDDGGQTKGVQFVTGVSADKFCLDGQRLLQAKAGAYGSNLMTYNTTINDYAQIESKGTSGNGPSYFTVTMKDGTIYEYGNSAGDPDASVTDNHSQVMAQGQGGSVRVWALDKVTDLNGNYISYVYGNNQVGSDPTTATEYWPVSISYTGNDAESPGTLPDHKVVFSYEPLPSGTVQAGYLHGSLITNSWRLHAIQVEYNNTATFTYNLTYQLDASNNRSQLSSVQECGSDGVTCLPSTSIQWQSAQMGWSADVPTGVQVSDIAHAKAVHLMDVDGDGIQDLVYPDGTSGDWMVMFGQPGGGFSKAVDTGEQLWSNNNGYAYALTADVTGDGRMDLMVPIPTGWQVMQGTGNQTGQIFRTPANNLPYLGGNNSVTGAPIYEGNAWAVDFSGRGLSDLIYTDGSTVYLIKNGGDGSDSYSTTAQPIYTGGGLSKQVAQTLSDVPVDFDGSGRAGAVAQVSNNPNYSFSAFTSTEAPSFVSLGSITEANALTFPMDANGDGVSDVMSENTASGGIWQMSISTGVGFTTVVTNVGANENIMDSVIADTYGDGKQEAIVANPSSSTGFSLLLTNYNPSTSGYASVVYTVASVLPSNYVSGTARVGNIEASGHDDIVYAEKDSSGNITWHYALHNGNNQPFDVVTKITDGLGNYCTFSYESLANGIQSFADGLPFYTKGSSATYPTRDIQPAMQVVSSYQVSDGIGGVHTYNFTYTGAQTELQGRGFLGFVSRTITDESAGTMETIQYAQAFPYTGMVTSDKLTIGSTGTQVVSDTENSGLDAMTQADIYATAYMPFFDKSVVSKYNDVGSSQQLVSQTTTILSTADFDPNYGNLLTEQVSTLDGATNKVFSTTSTVSYATPNPLNYCVSLPQSTTTQRDFGSVNPGSPRRTASTAAGDVDTINYCRLNSRTLQDNQDSTNVTTADTSFDNWGNVTGTTVSGSNVTISHITAYSFQGPAGSNNEFPTSITYSVGDTNNTQIAVQSSWNYALGTKASDTDANGNPTSYSYDLFGRLTSVTRPDKTQTLYSYNWCGSPTQNITCPSSAAYEVTTTEAPNPQNTDNAKPFVSGYTAYDSMGRAVEQGTVLLGGVMSRVDTTYDTFGHVAKVMHPYITGATLGPFYTTYSYNDPLHRLTDVFQPENANDNCNPMCEDHTSLSYSVASGIGFAVAAQYSVSTGTHNTTKYTDALGEVVEMLDANNGSTIYIYDAFGDLTHTYDADNNETTLGYDGLGHKTSMTDPDMGQWSYQVDALGEVLCQTDAKGQSAVMIYDGLGRIKEKREAAPNSGCNPSSYTSSFWTYDQPGALGLPSGVSDATSGFQRAYGYDTLGRPTTVNTTIPGAPAPYTLTTGYDPDFGRVQTVQYPASIAPATDSTPTAVATASPNPYVLGSTGVVTIDGSASTDPAGDALQYQWLQTGGASVPFDAAAKTFSFTPSATGTYSFKLQVIDSESAISAPVSVSVVVDPATPGAPSGNSENYSSTVSLNWSAVAGGALYKVYESTNGTSFNLPNPVAGTSTSIPNLTDGNYYFEIQACDSSGSYCSTIGPASSAINVLLPPNPPTGLNFSAPTVSTTGSYTLSWTGSATATSYKVYLSNNSLQCTTGATNCPFSGKANGLYTYYVVAINAAGTSSGSAQASKTVQLPPGAPGKPTANPNSGNPGDNFTLTWPAASGDVQYYTVNGGGNGKTYTTTSAPLVMPLNDGTYNYYATACNTANGAANCGANSASTTVTVSGTVGGGGCKTCSQQTPTGGGTTSAPTSGTTAAPVSSTGGAPTASIMVPEAIRPVNLTIEQHQSLAPAPTHVDSAVGLLKQERLTLIAAQPKQAPESVLRARAARRVEEQQPALLPPAPGADIAAYNAALMARLKRNPKAPAFEPPAYIAFGGAHVTSATGNPYQFEVTYSYDPSSGALEAVSDTATQFIYWRAATGSGTAPVDAFGHLTGYIDGNNVDTVNNFDAATGAILSIGTTGSGSVFGMQNLYYAWDGFGNLQQRCDANKGLTEGFTYDGINRLQKSTVYSGGATGQCGAGPNVGTVISATYTNSGNIQTRSNTGLGINATYNYTGTTGGPHAVKSITDPSSNVIGSYAYDANGNMVCRDAVGSSCTGTTFTPNITWNADNLPTQITGPNGSSSFSYSPDLQRYAQTATDASGNVTNTTYIGGLFEVVSTSSGTQYRHNIMAVGGVVATHTINQNGVVETDYIHSDHLGSGDVITNDSGNIATDPVTGEQQIMSFDAFGLRRDPSNWAYDLTLTQIGGLKAKTNRGYTYQEQLDNVGLVHMNGRVYDPTTARMISADPTVPSPLYSQAFNRYAYVYNNPLNATDPSGFACDPTGTGDISSCPDSAPPVGMCWGSAPCLPQTPNEAPTTQTGTVDLGEITDSKVVIQGTNVSTTDVPDAPAQPVSGTGSAPPPGQIKPIDTKPFECLDPESCGAENDTDIAMHQTEGWQVWDGVCFGCGWASSFSFNPELQDNQIPGLARWENRQAARQAALNNVPHSPGAAVGPMHGQGTAGTGGAVGTPGPGYPIQSLQRQLSVLSLGLNAELMPLAKSADALRGVGAATRSAGIINKVTLTLSVAALALDANKLRYDLNPQHPGDGTTIAFDKVAIGMDLVGIFGGKWGARISTMYSVGDLVVPGGWEGEWRDLGP